MNQNYPYNFRPNNNFRPNRPHRPPNNNSDNNFLGPFLLGGLAGGLISPLFYNNRNYYPYPYYPYPIYYGPFNR